MGNVVRGKKVLFVSPVCLKLLLYCIYVLYERDSIEIIF